MFDKIFDFLEKRLVIIYAIVVLAFAFLTYFSSYQYPNASVWDEVYHVSSGEKYLENTFFMESHPPLGKLFIGLGEKLVNVNDSYNNLNPLAKICLANTPASPKYKNAAGTEQEYKITETVNKSQITRDPTLLEMRKKLNDDGLLTGPISKTDFTKTDSIAKYPDHFSFCGFRLFPVLFAVFTAPLFFILLYLLLRNSHLAFIFSSLYVFDNALIVQARAAMLDTVQIFFILAVLVLMVWGIAKFNLSELETKLKRIEFWKYALLGVFLGLIVATKHNGAIFVILPLIWAIYEWWQSKVGFNILNGAKKILPKVILSLLLLVITYSSVLYVHAGLGQKIVTDNTNNSGKYYLGKNIDESDKLKKIKNWAQSQYLEALDKKQTWNPKYFPAIFITNQIYMEEYHAGVPKLDLTKSSENGSYPTNWPVMNRTISYRWETADGNAYRYTYLIGNPVIWFFGLVGMLLAVALICAFLFFDLKISNRPLFGWICVFALLYIIYMAAMLETIQIRVLYLYHYFVPLIFSLILFAMVVKYIIGDNLEKDELDISFKNQPFRVYTILVTMVFVIVISFAFYSPLTYYNPLTNQQFKQRNVFDFWQMKNANGQ